MKKLLYLIIIFIFAVGLTTEGFTKNIIEDCSEGCSCCGHSCECQPKICSSNWQPTLFIKEVYVLPGLLLSGFLHDEIIFTYREKPLRQIFHPPRYA